MTATEGNLIPVAGNSVLDLLARGVSPGTGQEAKAYGHGSVSFLEHPVEAALGGTALGAILKGWFADAGVGLVGPVAGSTAANVLPVTPDGTLRWHY